MARYRRSRKKKHQPEGKSGVKPYIVGLTISILITLMLFIIWSVVLAVSSLAGNSIDYFVIGVIIISVFCGGFVCAKGTRKNGWMSGGIVGIIYLLLLLILGSGMVDAGVSLKSLLYLGMAYVVGGFGGTTALSI